MLLVQLISLAVAWCLFRDALTLMNAFIPRQSRCFVVVLVVVVWCTYVCLSSSSFLPHDATTKNKQHHTYVPDNLAANYSRELADYIIYVIDVAGGDKVPRKGGPGITQSDLLVVNKTDLAEAVGADLEVREFRKSTELQ